MSDPFCAATAQAGHLRVLSPWGFWQTIAACPPALGLGSSKHGSPDVGIRVADRITPDMVAALPVTERRARLSTTLAWLHEQLDQDPGVIRHLKLAQTEAPEEFRYSILSQQLVSRCWVPPGPAISERP